MPITIQEDREGRVSLWTFSDPFTAGELSDTIDVFQQVILQKAQKKVHLICDFTEVRHLPPNIMSAALKMIRKTHPMAGTVIEVTSNGFIHSIVSAFAKLTPNGMICVRKSMTEAFEEADRLIALEAENVLND